MIVLKGSLMPEQTEKMIEDLLKVRTPLYKAMDYKQAISFLQDGL